MAGLLISSRSRDRSKRSSLTVPGKGAPDTLDVASWNIEFLGDSSNGPSNESLQRANARDILAGADMDVWGLAEIVSTSGFNALKAQLPGYGGFLANDPLVTSARPTPPSAAGRSPTAAARATPSQPARPSLRALNLLDAAVPV